MMKLKLALALILSLSLPAAAKDTVVTILHTNDLHGRVLSINDLSDAGPGGLARVATLVRAIRKEKPEAILLDAGDAVQGTPVEFRYQGETMMKAMTTLGYDAVTLGNHEFDWTQTGTEVNAARAGFPFLSANALDRSTGKPFGGAKEYIILNRGGVRVAVFGLTTLLTPDIEWPPAINRVEFADPLPIARRLVRELRSKADVIVCLSHLGLEPDKALAKSVPGIDVIIGGHSHSLVADRLKIGGTFIAQAKSYGAWLGRFDMRLKREKGAWKIASVNGSGGKWWPAPYPQTALLPVDETVERAPDIEQPYRTAWNETDAMLARQIGFAEQDIPARDSKNTLAVPALLAELLRSAVLADIAVMPSEYGPRIPAGPVTNRTLYGIVGGYTRQNVVMYRVPGRVLRKEVCAAQQTEGKDPVQFAGLGGSIVRDNGTVRWEQPTVNGRPLEDSREYTIAGGAYPMMNLKDAMECPMVSDRLGWLKPLLASAIESRGTLHEARQNLVIPTP